MNNKKLFSEDINPSFLNFQNSLFSLRPIVREDLETLFAWRNNLEVNKYLSSSPPKNMQEQRQWYSEYLQDTGSLHFMTLKRDAEDIKMGYCPLYKIDKNEMTAEFGIVIGNTNYIMSGLGIKLGLTFLTIAFKYLGLQAIYGSNHPQNKTSNKFHSDFIGSTLIKGPHKYRKDDQLLFEVNKLTFETFETKLISRSKSWKSLFDIKQIAL